MKKIVFITLVLGVLCVFPNLSMAQSWNIVYGGDYVPTLPPGSGQQLQARDVANPFDWTMWNGGGALVPTGTPSFVWLRDNETASNRKWDEAEDGTGTLDASFPSGGTLVTRIRRPAGAVGTGDIDVFVIANNGQNLRIRVGNGIVFNDGSGVTIPSSSLTNGIDVWHVFRFTWQVESGVLRVITYVDGSSTPIDSHLTNATTTTTQWKMGSSSGGTGEYYMDWLLLTDDGAYAPGAGPALPSGYTENSPGAPEPTFTPGPPTSTPTPTGTPTPCQAGTLCNGSFDSGVLTPWVQISGPGNALTGSVSFCGINPHSSPWQIIHVANGGEIDGTYYQQVFNYPSTDANVTCYVVADCNPDHEEYGQIGIDPLGGTDPLAASVVWSPNLDAPGGNVWQQHSLGPVSTTPGSTITVFFRIETPPGGGTDTWNIFGFDDLTLSSSLPTPTPTPQPTIDATDLQRKFWDPYK